LPAVAIPTDGVTDIVGPGTSVISACMGSVCSPTSNVPNATVQAAAQTLTQLALSPKTQSLNAGQSHQYTATGTFTGTGECVGPNSFDVTSYASWTSGNGAIAQVDPTGQVQAVAAGTTSISAHMGGLTDSGTVTVTDKCVNSLAITYPGNAGKVPADVVVPLTVTATYSDSSSTALPPGSGGVWSSGSVNAATWQLDVGATDPGSITYTLNTGTCGGSPKTATVTIGVDGTAAVTALTLYLGLNPAPPATANIEKGGHQDFSAWATFGGGYPTYNVSSKSTWANNPAITGLTNGAAPAGATVLPAQRFSHTGNVGGTTQVTAVYKTQTAPPATLVINGANVTGVQIISTSPVIPAAGFPGGLPLAFTARVTYSDGSTADNPACIGWNSSTGYLTFGNPGDAANVARSGFPTTPTLTTVTATCTGVPGTYDLTINTATLGDLVFSPASPLTVPQSTNTQLTVTGTYSNGTQFDVSKLVIPGGGGTHANATTDGVNGTVVHSLAVAGSDTLTFSKESITRNYVVNVSGACLSSMVITPYSGATTLANGQTVDLAAQATDTSGTTSNVSGQGTWSPTNATVQNQGAVTGPANRYKAIAVGATTVTFSMTGANVCTGGDPTNHTLSATTPINVTAATISFITIKPQPIAPATSRRLPVGESLQLQLIPTYSDGSVGADVALDAQTNWYTVWGHGGPHVNLPQNGPGQGIVTGLIPGLDQIIATYQGTMFQATMNLQTIDCGAPTLTAIGTAGKLPIG
jgi:hypothetical protein